MQNNAMRESWSPVIDEPNEQIEKDLRWGRFAVSD